MLNPNHESQSYFYFEARHYQRRAASYAKEAMWWLNRYLENGADYDKWAAQRYQDQARFEAKEARHYLMLAINPDHYKTQTPFQD